MKNRLSLLVPIGFFYFGCATSKSSALPDYANTRIRVNTGSAQSASLEAKTASLEIKNSKKEISKLSSEIDRMKQEIQSARIRLSR